MRTSKHIFLIAVILAAVLTALPAKVTTVADASSPTGYTTTFEYVNDEATDVLLVGSFMFYKDRDLRLFAWNDLISKVNDDPNRYLEGPESWSKGDMRHINDESFSDAMEKKDGVWTYTMQLPSASYMYFFKVSYDGGETWVNRVTDPDNVPVQNGKSLNSQYRSKFFVPYDPEKQAAEDDWTFVMPIEDESKQGTILYLTYTGAKGEVRPTQVYLPAGYDEGRAEPYKTLYMVHGGGGNEGDWFHQGNVNNIADRLIADGTIEPFVIVTLECDSFKLTTRDHDGGLLPDFRGIITDVIDCLIPYIEENFNVSGENADRALVGLSRGSNVVTSFLFRVTEKFGYYGLLSRAATYLYTADTNLELVKNAKIYMGAGFADRDLLKRLYHQDEVSGVVGMSWLFDDLGVNYNDSGSIKIVPGAHDWFTWPQLAYDFFSDYLWR